MQVTDAVQAEEDPSSKVAVVTGGAGFVGRHLVTQLVEAGHQVRVVDVAEMEDLGPQVTAIQGSVLDREILATACAGADWCFHLAAIAHLWQRNPETYRQVNVLGTQTVLEVAGEAGVSRTVVTASEAMYGARQRRRSDPPITETTPIPDDQDLPGPYSRSKAAAARVALAARAAGQDVVLAIPSTPIGPGDPNQTPPTRMLADLLAGRLPAYVACDLDLIDVRDIAAGHLLIAEHVNPADRYLLCGESWELIRLLNHAAECAGVRATKFRVPAWFAAVVAVIQEGWAGVTGRPPAASREGVRLSQAALQFDASESWSALGLSPEDLQTAIADAVADL